MELYECVETCPHCDSDNVLQWNTEVQGYVAFCKACGKKMMLCDECHYRHREYNEPDCDWCEDGNDDGVCFRDTSSVCLETYGSYEKDGNVQHILCFKVPKNWLWNYAKENGWESVNDLVHNYIWDDTMDIYAKAIDDKVIIETWEEEE